MYVFCVNHSTADKVIRWDALSFHNTYWIEVYILTARLTGMLLFSNALFHTHNHIAKGAQCLSGKCVRLEIEGSLVRASFSIGGTLFTACIQYWLNAGNVQVCPKILIGIIMHQLQLNTSTSLSSSAVC